MLLQSPGDVIALELFGKPKAIASYELPQRSPHKLRFIYKPASLYQSVNLFGKSFRQFDRDCLHIITSIAPSCSK
jgi:hypothetical protein